MDQENHRTRSPSIENMAVCLFQQNVSTISNILGPVHTTPEEFENGALFLRLGLPSTLIWGKLSTENETFRKRS